MTLRLGTRGSALALAQSRLVADAITAATGEPVTLVEIVTEGDRSTAPVQRLGVGVFVSALRDALAAKEIDVAVHSYKDLPTAPVEGLVIAAVPPREDPRDAFVSRTHVPWEELPAGSRIGTGALRRIAQLRALRRGWNCEPMRGNVDTRLRKLADGEFDAVVLAAAGLHRLGRAHEITQLLPPEVMLPAPAQGALAVECRARDHSLVDQLSSVDDEHTRAAVLAERTLLATLEAGCSAPVAALATVACAPARGPGQGSPLGAPARGPGQGSPLGAPARGPGQSRIELWAAVFAPDGQHAIRRGGTAALSDAVGLGSRVAAQLLSDGADSLLGENG
jgi:hydroxymethylbilane synthase